MNRQYTSVQSHVRLTQCSQQQYRCLTAFPKPFRGNQALNFGRHDLGQYLARCNEHLPTRFRVESTAKLSIPTSVKKYG